MNPLVIDPRSTAFDGVQYTGASRSIVYSILFVIPLLLVYALGVAMGAHGDSINGGDMVLRYLFFAVQSLLGPVITIIVVILCIIGLIGYAVYVIREKGVRLVPTYFFYMLGESAAWAFGISIIIGIGMFHAFPTLFSFDPRPELIERFIVPGISSVYTRLVVSMGAGVFEELVFRVGILGAWIFFATGRVASQADLSDTRVLKAIGGSSLLFMLAHLGSASILGLITIFMGSLILSFVYLRRGYGIAAGAHALYDVFIFFGIIG